MWWFGYNSNIWILKSGICAYWAFKSLDLFGSKFDARGWILIQETQSFTGYWARGSSGWSIPGCNWMFVGMGEIYTRTNKLMSKVNFVISLKLEWKIVWFFSRLLIHAFQSEILCIINPCFFTICCCLQQDIRTTREVFHYLLSKHEWSQYYKLKCPFCDNCLVPVNAKEHFVNTRMLSVGQCWSELFYFIWKFHIKK